MADNIYVFNKTREQRLEEFKDILCSRASPVLAADIADEWSYSLETFIEPTGWQALWKISRQICEELNVLFPKFVIVKVLSVDFKELTALVKVERVQDDISIPGLQEVPLVQLFPTKVQEDPVLNIDFTANFIDQLRFFYNHLWCPWDVEDADDGDWPTKFLEPRLQMFYEMNDGTIPAKLADKIHRKREQARKLFEQKQELEGLLNKSIEGDVNAENILSPAAQVQTFNLMQVHLDLSPLLTELALLENISMRKLVIKHYIEEEENKKQTCGAIMVWETGPLDGFIEFLTACKSTLDTDTSIESASSLQSAIETAVCGNTIFIHKGVHKLNRVIESALCIIGVGSVTPVVKGKERNSYIFSVRNTTVKFKNVKFDSSEVADALQVLKNSTVEFINCTFANEDSQDGRGVVVNSGGSVLIDGCSFSGFHVAVCCYPGSQVTVKNSSVQNCAFGIETFENSQLQISGSLIKHCKEAALFVCKVGGVLETGGKDLLQQFQKIKVSELQLEDNTADVVLRAKADLFVP